MKRRVWLLAAALLGAVGAGTAQAAAIKLRPQGEAMSRAVQAALAQISTRDVPMTLDTTSGTILTVGGTGASAAPFNPDELARVVQVGGERRIEFSPHLPQAGLVEAVKQELAHELSLKEWTPAAAQLRFGGADLNGDGKIDLSDLAILMNNYGVTSPTAGDLNQDRRVDDTDVRIFAAQYHAAADVTAPDPAATAASDSTGTGGTTTGTGTSTGASPASSTPSNSTPANSIPANSTPASSTSTGTPSTTSPSPTSPATSGTGAGAGTGTVETVTGSNSTGTGTNTPNTPAPRPTPTP